MHIIPFLLDRQLRGADVVHGGLHHLTREHQRGLNEDLQSGKDSVLFFLRQRSNPMDSLFRLRLGRDSVLSLGFREYDLVQS